MARNNYPKYTVPAIVVVHGDSERIVAEHIKSNLRLNLFIHSGKTSIQINGLVKELKAHFPSVSALRRNPKLELNIEKNIIHDFKIFTLMDTDDCSDETRQKYLDRTLFDEYQLKDYIEPIYTIPDLEHVFFNSHLIPRIFKDDEKVEGYRHCFPKISPPFTELKTKEDDLIKKADALRSNRNTNFEEFIDYCIAEARRRRIGH